MLGTLRKVLIPSNEDSLADAFSRLGWIGFWIQLAIGSIPVFFAVYAFILGGGGGVGTRSRSLLVEYLTIAGLIVLVFTTIWSYRYTRLGAQIADPARRPSEFAVQRVAWIGVAASAVSILFFICSSYCSRRCSFCSISSARPSGRTGDSDDRGGRESWVSAADVLNVLALNLSLFSELTVLVFSIWLLFRSTNASAEFPYAGNEQ